MAGIYIHIPFCKQRCNYCDFHFSTNLKYKDDLVDALLLEIDLRKNEISSPIQTVYFGGGTPSILNEYELEKIIDKIYTNFNVVESAEVTLEANPDDLTPQKINQYKNTNLNRLSIGVQSFFEEDLRLMSRAHNAKEAEHSIKNAQNAGIYNISIDLIYGSPSTTHKMWEENLKKVIELNIPHLSSYALTVEPNTILEHQIKTGKLQDINESKQEEQFNQLCNITNQYSFEHYEISNFSKKGFQSKHNSNYWKGVPYLGIGPSAHSYNGKQRSWNINNNNKYIKSILNGKVPQEVETLSLENQFNELIMIRLRTIWGVNLKKIEEKFPKPFYDHLIKEAEPFIEENQLIIENDRLIVTSTGKFFTDGIAAQLFIV